ncbi:MAG: hypothetical protein SVX28_03545 [Pseudomonadota bacterium]|nr:hypothetical protein [Pseudomonadota bacterium]
MKTAKDLIFNLTFIFASFFIENSLVFSQAQTQIFSDGFEETQNEVPDRIWVKIRYLGNYVWTIIGIPTGPIYLFDNIGRSLAIEPYGCITLGNAYPTGYIFSAWEISEASKTPPSPDEINEKICDKSITGTDAFGNERCIKYWYEVSLNGFKPVQHVAGCSIYLPFDFF